MLRVLAALAISILILMAYGAEAENGAGPIGRYTLSEVEDGYLRLDTAEGRVSFCHRKQEGWVCELIADERAAYEAEIARLEQENRRLKDELAALKRGEKDDSSRIELPRREDVDQVMSFLEGMMRRFFDMVRSLKEEAARQRTGAPEPEPAFPPLRPHEPSTT